jgi:hypothetical protein
MTLFSQLSLYTDKTNFLESRRKLVKIPQPMVALPNSGEADILFS